MKKLPLLEESINEERLVVTGKGEFVVSMSADNNYVYVNMIPDSKMLDSIANMGKDKFRKDAIKFLSNKFGVDFTDDTGDRAGYSFKFHVSELLIGLKDIMK